MSRHRRWLWTAVFSVLGVAALTSCQSEPEPPTTVTVTRIVVETAVPQTILVAATAEVEETATAEPPPRKDLVICTTQEPVTLYPYGQTMPVETAVQHAIFENDFTTLTYAIQPQGLKTIPSLDGDDAVLRSVTVQTGDTVVNAAGEIVTLTEGTAIRIPTGEELIFDGAPTMMNQLVVTFTMQPRIWANGEPVTAADSVFSFNLDANPDTPSNKQITARTARYEAVDELTVRWTGLPGFHDHGYQTRFWQPLPRHLWEKFPAADLLTEPASSQLPVGDGPFMLVDWILGEQIRLEPNPFYYRAADGMPYLDSVVFRFKSDGNELIDALLSGECDIVTPEDLDMTHIPLLLAAETNGLIRPYFQTGTVFEHIDFGINSWGNYGDGRGRPDWFEDVRVRQAMTLCTDRRQMVDEIMYGRSRLINSYIPDNHPLFPSNITRWPYDVQAANILLDEAGYLDSSGDGIREDPATGLPFRVTLGAVAGDMQQQISQHFQKNMRDCGIIVEPYYLPAEEWYANGPDGPLFGRRFDLGTFAWIAEKEPYCFLYTSGEITGPRLENNPATGQAYGGWDAANETGWSNPEFDTTCQTAQNTLPGMLSRVQAHQQAQQIFAQNLPVIPLFLHIKIAAAQTNIRNIQMDPTQPSALWNLHEIDIEAE